jgi:hypothetical protein
MNRHTSKLEQHKHEETVSHQQSTAQTAAVEFDSAEQAIRHDSTHTVVPPAVAERLRKSVEREPRPRRSWWRRVFGQS